MTTPFYDPQKSYEENFKNGPYGAFAGLSPEASAKGDGEVFENKSQPQFDFLGQKVFSPFGIGAGPLINGRFIKAAIDKGFDLCTYKTVRTVKYPCNPMPNVVRVNISKLTLEQAEKGIVLAHDFVEPLTITNSFGVPSWSPNFWQKDMKEAVEAAGIGRLVIGSFQGTPKGDEQKYIKDFADCAKLVKETGAKVLEVNLSCPNEGTARLLCFDTERTAKVVEAIKNEIGDTPLIMKLAYFKDQNRLSELIDLVGKSVQGIEAINTIMSKILDENGEPGFKDGRTHSGVCGAGIKWAGLEMVERLKKLRDDGSLKFTIIGVGGVMNADDYQDFMSKGADAVMSATGAMWNPFLAQEIKKNL